MLYQSFIEEVCNSVSDLTKSGEQVNVHKVLKNNGLELDGLVIVSDECNVVPTIYINSYFNQYLTGKSIDTIAEEIYHFYLQNKNKCQLDVNSFSEFENIKDMIAYKIINYERNIDLLKDIPYKKILDLAIVFYLKLNKDITGDFDAASASILIHNSHLDMWGIDIEKLYDIATANTPGILKSRIKSINTIINEIGQNKDETFSDLKLNKKGMQIDYNEVITGNALEMYILTNAEKTNGASCMFYKDVLKEFSKALGGDLYILPSSIHEVILLKKDNHNLVKSDLIEMVHEVNVEEVADDEILSDNVYEYNFERDEISI